jgi:hypothetical protein
LLKRVARLAALAGADGRVRGHSPHLDLGLRGRGFVEDREDRRHEGLGRVGRQEAEDDDEGRVLYGDPFVQVVKDDEEAQKTLFRMVGGGIRQEARAGRLRRLPTDPVLRRHAEPPLREA